MNFISPEAIIENAKYKRDKEPTDFQTIPYKTLVADNFEQSMKKYLSNPTSTHYSSAYANELGLMNIPTEGSKENYPAIKGINTGNKEWTSDIGRYEYKAAEIPSNNCGKKFKELIEVDNPKIEKGISYPEHFSTRGNLLSNLNTECLVGIVIIVILIIVVFKMYIRILKLQHKNAMLKMQLRTINECCIKY